MIGRRSELTELSALLLGGETRLVTLCGPGGIGKSRLALAAGDATAHHFGDGVRFVPLAAVSDPDLVASAVAVGLPELQGQPLDVVERLRDLNLLVILDNFEHLLAAAGFVGQVLAACPGVTVLVTSQALLELQGERVVPVSPLEVPGPGDVSLERLRASPAVALLESRARETQPQFRVTDENAEAVVRMPAA